MKGRIEHAHHRQVRHEPPASLDAHDVRWVVQRSKVLAFLQRLHHCRVDQHGSCELLAAVHDAMPNGRYLPEIRDHADFRVDQALEDVFHRLFMISRDYVPPDFVASIGSVSNERLGCADSLHVSPRHAGRTGHVEQLILQ